AYLVNVGRGSAIDETALTDALNEGKLAGAALDVMQTEPVPANSPLRTAKNILLTPHCAGQMTLDYTREKSVEMFCEDLENFLNGRPLVHEVDRKRGY
ncbi:MAG: NAD(P)-dependent oxidoreductase, partial [Bilifractor sp.]